MRRSTCVVSLTALGFFGTFAACVGDDPATSSAPPPAAGTPVDASGGADSTTLPPDSGVDAAPSCASPSQACGQSCVDVAKDAAHCGRCGHDCAGGACTGGLCQPLTLTKNTNPLLNSSRISTDGASVCWTIAAITGFVYCVGAAAAAQVPTEVWAGKRPGPVLVRAGKVLWTAQGVSSSTLRLMTGTPGAAGSGTQLREWVPDATISAYDGYQLDMVGSLPYLSWTESMVADGSYALQVVKCVDAACAGFTKVHTVTGSSAASLETRANGMASDAAAVYVTYGGSPAGSVARVTASAGVTVLASSEVDPRIISADNGFVYWDTNTFKIRRSPVGAAAPSEVSTPLGNVLGLVAHGDTLYWTEIGGSGVYMAPAAGGARTVYLAGDPTDQPGPLAHDDKALYWADKSTGAVRKIAFK